MPANLNPPRYQNLSSPGRSASSVPLWRTPGAKASRLAGAHHLSASRPVLGGLAWRVRRPRYRGRGTVACASVLPGRRAAAQRSRLKGIPGGGAGASAYSLTTLTAKIFCSGLRCGGVKPSASTLRPFSADRLPA